MKKVRTHTFNGVRYHIGVSEPYSAWCDNPDKSKNSSEYPAIRLVDGLPYGSKRGAKLGLNCLIHECLHAEDWNKTEDTVDRVSTEIANLLWRLGYRRMH